MPAVICGPLPGPGWALIDIGTETVGVAERDALGTSARVAAWPPYSLARVLAGGVLSIRAEAGLPR